MATNTYVALQTQTLATSASSVTFSAIPQGYTDLVLVGNYFFVSTGVRYATLRVGNGTLDTGSNYSDTYLDTYPSTPNSGRNSNNTTALFSYSHSSGVSTTASQTAIANFMNYSNTTTYKSIINRNNSGTNMVSIYGNLWRSTAAIDTIQVIAGAADFATGSTFSIYGIRAEGVSPAPKATGGAIYSDSTYYYHAFGASGVFTPSQALTVDYLVVAGGGGGSTNEAGGGGAGGLRSTVTATGGLGTLESALSLSSATNYTVTVGGGGAAAGTVGTQGSNSVFATITSTGGGGGGNGGAVGGAGGSSGGGGAYGSNAAGTRTASPVQGFSGGIGSVVNGGAGGGGGAGAVGVAGTASTAGNGGAGLELTAFATATGTGVNKYYAGGGGGGAFTGSTQSTGGAGGGGAGGAGTPTVGSAAIANTGGGGGGGGTGGAIVGGAGGSGLVIVRYTKA